MKRYAFHFETHIRFSNPVGEQHYLLRCLPWEGFFQQVSQEEIHIFPIEKKYFPGKDHFGNRTLSGSLLSGHQEFSFSVTGQVLSGSYIVRQPLEDLFVHPSALTIPGPVITSFAEQISGDTIIQKVKNAAELVHSQMQYLPESTTINVTAEEALAQKKGVCQDYSHILISLLRAHKIPARYCAGLLPGEGETHAWVEYYADGAWFAIDPTHNRAIEYGYIKFSHGRDGSDCLINRGSFSETVPGTSQDIKIQAKVEEIPW